MADEGPRGTEVVVRSMREADLDATLEMFALVAAEGGWLGTEAGFDVDERRAGWRRALSDPSRCSLVAVSADGTIVGNASLHLASYGVSDIGMAISAEWRGLGLGARLLDALLAAASDLGAHKVSLQVWPHNTRAIALYEGRGFVEEGRLRRHYRRSSGELWDALVMGLVLDETSPGASFDGQR